MSALSDYDYTKLLHDIRRIGQGIQIIQDEELEDKRKLIADLLRGEVDRLYGDIEEMREVHKNGHKE